MYERCRSIVIFEYPPNDFPSIRCYIREKKIIINKERKKEKEKTIGRAVNVSRNFPEENRNRSFLSGNDDKGKKERQGPTFTRKQLEARI